MLMPIKVCHPGRRSSAWRPSPGLSQQDETKTHPTRRAPHFTTSQSIQPPQGLCPPPDILYRHPTLPVANPQPSINFGDNFSQDGLPIVVGQPQYLLHNFPVNPAKALLTLTHLRPYRAVSSP